MRDQTMTGDGGVVRITPDRLYCCGNVCA